MNPKRDALHLPARSRQSERLTALCQDTSGGAAIQGALLCSTAMSGYVSGRYADVQGRPPGTAVLRGGVAQRSDVMQGSAPRSPVYFPRAESRPRNQPSPGLGLACMTSSGPKYFLRDGNAVREFVFFISSASDVTEQRELLTAMIRSADNQFRLRRDSTRPFTFVIDKWELDAGRRTQDMNAEFVRRVREAHAVIVLLESQLRPGTEEEIEAVLQESQVQVSVIWMDRPEDSRRYKKLRKYLKEKSDRLAYVKTGPPGSQKAICAMVDVITAALAHVTQTDHEEDPFSEAR